MYFEYIQFLEWVNKASRDASLCLMIVYMHYVVTTAREQAGFKSGQEENNMH